MDTTSLHTVSPASYNYQLLKPNEIRLALLEPSPHDNGPLSVRLVPTDIEAPPPYDAISYVWGDDAADTVPILCDGLFVRVTKNLHWTLSRAQRRHHHPDSSAYVVVWADALCINQHDDVERGAQVALMGRIYTNARTVLVCMGPELSYAGGSLVASLLSEWDASAATAGVDIKVDDVHWRALGALTRAPWFSRVWVLQEVGLARDPRVIYGGGPDDNIGIEEFSYRLLRCVVSWARSRMSSFAAYMKIEGLLVHDWWLDWSQPRPGGEAPGEVLHYQFLDLLDQGALLQCRDPRDRVYAFLGHPVAAAAGTIVPDYTKPKIQVFQETTLVLLRDSGIRTLSSVEHDTQTIEEDTPSWVVRWDVTPTFNNIWNSYGPTYSSAAGLGTGGALELNGDCLQVEGVVVDSVLAVFPVRLAPSTMGIWFFSANTDSWHPLVSFSPELEQDTTAPFAYNATKSAILAHTLCGRPWDDQDQDAIILRMFSDYITGGCERHNTKKRHRRRSICKQRPSAMAAPSSSPKTATTAWRREFAGQATHVPLCRAGPYRSSFGRYP
ncbi:hypothetical protein PG997_010845 [Apiospora hydei]|uniref:Heterokaryon incompatibility domain-containing protein n=1 Tax=Apiospora hydei TaxID=1337664 RepID=A0ABR1VID1_9PEZI